jgi:hypothetical protein
VRSTAAGQLNLKECDGARLAAYKLALFENSDSPSSISTESTRSFGEACTCASPNFASKHEALAQIRTPKVAGPRLRR